MGQPPLNMNQITLTNQTHPLHSFLRWSPVRELENIQRRIARAIDDSCACTNKDGDNFLSFSSWEPSVDIYEDDKGYVINAELPNIKKEDVKINIENGYITIQGERSFEKETKKEGRKYHVVERSYGAFSRSFKLPENSDKAKVEAKFENGVLSVTIPKSEESKPKEVEIKIS
jgi:HSP20 family protein